MEEKTEKTMNEQAAFEEEVHKLTTEFTERHKDRGILIFAYQKGDGKIASTGTCVGKKTDFVKVLAAIFFREEAGKIKELLETAISLSEVTKEISSGVSTGNQDGDRED